MSLGFRGTVPLMSDVGRCVQYNSIYVQVCIHSDNIYFELSYTHVDYFYIDSGNFGGHLGFKVCYCNANILDMSY